MAKASILKPFIRKWEGGYSNHPLDKGGPTKWGITQKTYNSMYRGDVKFMLEDQWDNIFQTLFWNPCNADNMIDQNVANIIVDWCWGSGCTSTKKRIQRLFGLKDDGIFGPKTMAVLNGDTKAVFDTIWKAHKAFFEAIVKNNPSQKVFLKGWMNRLNAITYNNIYSPNNSKQ